MKDSATPDASRPDRPEPGTEPEVEPGIDLHWAGRQRLLALIGTLISLAGLVTAIGGLVVLPVTATDAEPYAVAAVISAGVLVLCCAVISGCWIVQIGRWRTTAAQEAGTVSNGLRMVSLTAHLTSYAAVLVAMYTTLAGSALSYWDSLSGTLLGICFLLVIFGQILGGSQLLRRWGPAGTVPNHLRRLNTKVQSLR